MTMTHVSHFGLKMIGRTNDNILFEGSLGDCRRMAFAHGMEIERIEGAIVGIEGNIAAYAVVNPSKPTLTFFKDGGLILRVPDGYLLVMPIAKWDARD